MRERAIDLMLSTAGSRRLPRRCRWWAMDVAVLLIMRVA